MEKDLEYEMAFPTQSSLKLSISPLDLEQVVPDPSFRMSELHSEGKLR